MAHRNRNPQTAGWFTSSYSDNQGGQCVEAGRLTNTSAPRMAVRDSKNPDGPAFDFGHTAWTSFLGFATQPNKTL
ncbi:DUF397 domain-containing protein [Streptomyces sp. NPDC087294]|uniref:DUF397 domain-containing protein n=1 Tax=Streptomyces sp. NPDC087294 TaxID=3365777 RepID=UPI00381124FB